MTDAAPATATKDVVPATYRERYKATGGTNGDFIATALQKVGKDGVGSLQAVAKENGIDPAKWSHMNPGMQRMNLANVLRGTYLKGGTITILGKQYNIKHQIEDYTGKVENNDKAVKAIATYLELNDSDRVVAALKKVLFEPSAEDKAKAKQLVKDKAAAGKDVDKAQKAVTKAVAAQTKAKEALDAATKAATAAADALKGATDENKSSLETASKKANEKVGAAEDKVKAADAKVSEAQNALAAANDKVKAFDAPAA